MVKKRSRALILFTAVIFCISWAGKVLAKPREASEEEGKKVLYFSKEEVSSGSGDIWEGEGGEGGIKEKIQDEEGRQYWLESCQLVQILLPEREEWVREEVEYLAVEAEEQIPEQLQFQQEEEETGRKGEGELLRTFISASKTYWDEDFQISLRFYDYDADSFWLQDREVPGEGALDYLLEHPQLLLEAAGCSASGYQLEGLVWNGESYRVQETLCRDALAYGRKLVSDCTVEYSGQVVYPEEMQEKWEAVYALQLPQAPVQNLEETEVLLEAPKITEARPEVLPKKKVSFWQKLRRVAVYTVPFAVLLPVLVYFILLAGRRKKSKNG